VHLKAIVPLQEDVDVVVDAAGAAEGHPQEAEGLRLRQFLAMGKRSRTFRFRLHNSTPQKISCARMSSKCRGESTFSRMDCD